MNAFLLTAALIGQAPVPDGPVITLPTEIRAEKGVFTAIKAETDGVVVRWVVLDRGISLLPGEMLRDPKSTVVIGLKVGRFRIAAYTAKDDVPSKLAEAVVIVTDPDAPPGPVDPPKPPPTPPTPPGPADPLAAKIKAAFDADKSDAKAKKEAATALQGLFLELSVSIDKGTYANVGQFLEAYRQIAAKMVPGETIIDARRIAATEAYAVFGSDAEAQFSNEMKTKGKALLAKLAEIFGGLR